MQKKEDKIMGENEKKGGFKAFFGGNTDAISKLFVYHIAMCLFGLVVSIALEMLATQLNGEKEMLSVATYVGGVCAALIYLGLIYVCMWEKGAADKVKIDGGREKRSNVKGLLIWLLANSVFIAILLVIALLSFIPPLSDIHRISAIAGLYTNAMYYPFLWLCSYFNITALYALAVVPGALVATFSYISGVRGDRCIFPEPKRERNRKTR